MTRTQTSILFVPLGILAAAAQLIATREGPSGELAGGFFCGVLTIAGIRVLAPKTENLWLLVVVAAAASVAGLMPGVAGSGVAHSWAAWAAPLLAALLPGGIALRAALRGRKCQLCGTPLRGLLSFSCPRCQLTACENCWQFERNRCGLCEANQVALFPLDVSWWQARFGSQVHSGRCALCLRVADGQVAQWACAGCGHSQCRQCWDDNNGQCSRCEWTLPDLPEEVGAYLAAGGLQRKMSR